MSMLRLVSTSSFPVSRVFVSALVLLSATVAACSSSTETETKGTGGGGQSASARPPAPGPQKAGDGPAAGSVFAVKKLYLGDSDRDGTKNGTNGWRQYGFDLDGKQTTPSSTDVCKPASGGKPELVYNDGNNGIDNSFGEIILPIVL